MRALIVAIALSFIAIPAFAQEVPKPDAVTVPAAPDVKETTSGSDEPNLKVTAGSGGKSTSSLITGAPLMEDYVMGKSDAPITMIEYASLSCPHCAHFSGAVMPDIIKKYVDTGKLRYILRPFPLNEPALKAAMLVDCVGEQNSDKYYVFSKVLFDAQSKWAFDGNYLAGLETIANVGGLSREQFQHCINDTNREMKILNIKKKAEDNLKVPHTPYIFIAGEVYSGDNSVEAVSAFIDAKLAEDQKKTPVDHAIDKVNHTLDKL